MGYYGSIFNAFLKDDSGRERGCTAKTLKPTATGADRQAMLHELDSLKTIGTHRNVVNLVGQSLTGKHFLGFLDRLHLETHHLAPSANLTFLKTRFFCFAVRPTQCGVGGTG
jgi:hypothetical protein